MSSDAEIGIREAYDNADNSSNVDMLTPIYSDEVNWYCQIKNQNTLYVFDDSGNDMTISINDKSKDETVKIINDWLIE